MSDLETIETEPKYLADSIMGKLASVVGENRVSDTELERVVYSGDPASLPHFHYRWKRKYLVDYIVRVESVEELEGVLAIAREHNIPVIPRGGASSCMGSSSPTRGGLTIDIKPMNKILALDEDGLTIRVEAGITFDRLEFELNKKGLTLGIYPSSGKSAVIGGWFSCGGRAGIGTPIHGSLRDNTLEIVVTTIDGNTETISDDRLDLFCGSFGILGIITELYLKIRKIDYEFTTVSYSFPRLEHVCNAMAQIAKMENQPIFLKIGDKKLQSYSNPLEKGNYVLTVTHQLTGDAYPVDLQGIIRDNGGEYLGDGFSHKEWDLRYDSEFAPKEHTDTLMFQELWVHIDQAYEILKTFEKYRKSHKAPILWYGMLGDKQWIRLELMTMISAEQYLKFISSKGILHKMVKKSISVGGGPYAIGLQNSIYMKRAYPERLEALKDMKDKLDPKGLMNPDRVTSCMTSYWRINLLFALATAFRRLSKFIDRSRS